MTDASASASERRSIQRHLLSGLAGGLLLFGGLGGWSATAELAGAVVAGGQIVVKGNLKAVQHPEGGIVGEILVENGHRVTAGELLIRLDDTTTRASLAIIRNQIDTLAAKRMRLLAERDDAERPTVPAHLLERLHEPQLAQRVQAEAALFKGRRVAFLVQQQQLEERIRLLEKQVQGIAAQRKAKDEEIDLIQDELSGLETLFAKNLVPLARVAALRRERARLTGERGHLAAEAAGIAVQASEIRLQIVQLQRDRHKEAFDGLAEVESQLADLAERHAVARQKLALGEIRAPREGIVHQLAVHTLGGVVAAQETLLQIVPEQADLLIEARIQPNDIDQVTVGQTARLRFSAFARETTPELSGEVLRVSADLLQDETSGERYFAAHLRLDDGEAEAFEALQLLPGMPVEVFIATEERTALAYLIKPFGDHIHRALRED